MPGFRQNMELRCAENLAVDDDDEEVASDLLDKHIELVDSLPKDRPWPPFTDVKQRRQRKQRVQLYLVSLGVAALVIALLAVVAVSLGYSSKKEEEGAVSPSDMGLGTKEDMPR